MGNIVGSLEVPNLLHARKNLVLAVTERQRNILIGCVLGDVYIAPKGKVRIEQSHKQADYIAWKYRELGSLAYPSLPREINRISSVTGAKYQSIFFDLRQYFRPWRLLFYPNGKKIFPRGIALSPLTIAVWYMDDGCWTGTKCVIATEGFDDDGIARIQNELLSRYGIESLTGKNRKLTIRKQSHGTFFRLISSHIIPSMKYKIPNPVTTFSA